MKNKTSLLLFGLLIFSAAVYSQRVEKVPLGGCTTGMYTKADYMTDASGFLQRALQQRGQIPGSSDLISLPYTIKCFIRIFRNSNGSNQAITEETARQNFEEMNVQYSGHNICFQLLGIDFINDTYGNNMRYDSLLDTDYKTYLNTKRISSSFTIFVHDTFVESGSSGNAYDIPNSFVSIARWAANSADVRSIFAHEVGHALGLYHTFQKQYYVNGTVKSEQVTRNSANSCYNCSTFGDYCCDTPADYSGSQDSVNVASCTYSGTAKDTCSLLAYNPNTINIMSYMPWTCISATSTGFTTDQRTRLHAAINDVNGPVYSKLVHNAFTFGLGANFSSGFITEAAKYTLTSSGNNTYSGTTKFYGAINNSGYITISPGTTFAPASGGLASLTVTECN